MKKGRIRARWIVFGVVVLLMAIPSAIMSYNHSFHDDDQADTFGAFAAWSLILLIALSLVTIVEDLIKRKYPRAGRFVGIALPIAAILGTALFFTAIVPGTPGSGAWIALTMLTAICLLVKLPMVYIEVRRRRRLATENYRAGGS